MISIVIVGYNSGEYLKDCLESVFASSYNNFEVIFVDNDSKDESVEYIKNNFPQIELIRNKENLGFAAANNIGIQKAIDNRSDYVFLLNPDTIIDTDCVEKLIEKADSNIILQPLILLHDNYKKTDLVNSDGNILNFLGFSYCGGYKKNKSKILSDKEIAVASGAAVLIPVEIIRKIGMFDESFFMYHEDVDLSWRARIAGYNIKLIKDALVWHKYSFSRNKKKFFYAERNRLLFLHKNYETKTLLCFALMLFINELAMISASILGGWFLEKIKTYGSFCVIAGAHLEERTKISKIRKLNDKELKHFWSTPLDYFETKSRLLKYYNLFIKNYYYLVRKLI